MNTTPVDSLFSRQVQSGGKFLSEDELSQIQNDLSFLIQENKKLTTLLDQPFVPTQHQQPISPMPFLPSIPSAITPFHQPDNAVLPQFQPSESTLVSSLTSPSQNHTHPSPNQSPSPQPSYSSSPQPSYSSSPSPTQSPPPSDGNHHHEGKTITIVIETNKLVYLLLFIIIMIIILKK